VTREQFEEALQGGRVSELIHRIPTRVGEAFFIPSGRIHAIGAGNVIFEVQQNSDTTYRVFDWNRLGLDGKPRALHLHESLASINFNDPEPGVVEPQGEVLVMCPHFRVERWEFAGGDGPRTTGTEAAFAVFTVVSGKFICGGVEFKDGDFFLVAARSGLDLRGNGTVLRTTM
jgi:mannose-6-phosphate isomerase